MKVNKNQVLLIFAKLYEKNQSFILCIDYLYKMQLIKQDQYTLLMQSLKTNPNYQIILKIFNIKKTLAQKIIFLSKYHSIDQAIMISLNQINQINKVKKELLSSLIYPLILIVSTFLTMYFITSSILPKISMINQNAFNDYQGLIFTLKFIPLFMLICIFTIFICILISLYLYKYQKQGLFNLLKSIPLINNIFKKYCTLSFAITTKEILVFNNFDKDLIEQSLNYYSKQLFYFELKKIYAKLNRGYNLEKVIEQSILFEQEFKNLIYISSDSIAFEQLLDQFIEIKIMTYQSIFKKTLSVLVPVIILFCAIIIISLYVLIMLPTLEIEY